MLNSVDLKKLSDKITSEMMILKLGQTFPFQSESERGLEPIIQLSNLNDFSFSMIQSLDTNIQYIREHLNEINMITQLNSNLEDKIQTINDNLINVHNLLKNKKYQKNKQKEESVIHLIENQMEFQTESLYLYQLQTVNMIELPLYKNRQFSINFQLIKDGQVVKNLNKILLKMQIFTFEKIPREIEFNNQGQPIIGGVVTQKLLYSYCQFQKIQITETSWHFPNQKFTMQVSAFIQDDINPHQIQQQKADSYYVRPEQIKPFRIESFVVKSKRFPERHESTFINQDGSEIFNEEQ